MNKQSSLTQIYITKEYEEIIQKQNEFFLQQIKEYPLSFQQEFLLQFCKFIGIEITSKNKLISFHQFSSSQIHSLFVNILSLNNKTLSNELFYYFCIHLTRSLPDVFPSFHSQIGLPYALFNVLTVVKIMDYWKDIIDDRMTFQCKELFNEILTENKIQVCDSFKKTFELYSKNILMNRRQLLIIFNVLLEFIHFNYLKVCFLIIYNLFK